MKYIILSCVIVLGYNFTPIELTMGNGGILYPDLFEEM